MKAKLNIVYAPDLNGIEFGTPVVHYADACAAISDLESKCEGWRQEALKYENRARKAEADLELKEALRANAVKRCDNLLRQLEQMALLCESLQAKPKLTVHASDNCGHSLPRWDGPAKVL